MIRDQHLVDGRPEINLEVKAYHSIEEKFQNETLRPILKLQHPLTIHLLQHSKNFIKLKSSITDISQLQSTVEKYIQSDHAFRNRLLGSIIGMMTISEYEHYLTLASQYNKRILQMQVTRYITTLITQEQHSPI